MGLFSKLAKATRQGIPGRDSGGGMGSAMARPVAPRPTLIQGGPAYFTPEGYVPPVQPEQSFMPTDVMRDPIADMFAAQPKPIRIPGPPKMIDSPKPPDQIFIDDMPPLKEEPPMIVEEPPVMDQPTITMDDIDRIRRERGGPGRLDRNMIDYGYGPGIRPPLPPIDFDTIKPPSIQRRPLGSFENPLFTQIGVGLTGTPVEERSERLLRPIEIPKRNDEMSIDRMSIDRSRPLPVEEAMPISFPEPIPMLPRMPMPLPIASPLPSSPMPMAPINLPRLELPKTNRIDRQIPMMPRMRGRSR